MLVPLEMEKGQGLAEYALILVFVSLAALLMLRVLGPAIGNVYSNIIETSPF